MRSAPPIDRVIAALKRLPGIGEKSATRLAFHLLSAPETQVHELSEAIVRLNQEIVLCEECFDLTDASPCALCRNPSRDATTLCVVEEPADLAAIEQTASYHGRYHVLGGTLAPLDGFGPESLRVRPLVERVERGGVKEIILATNPNPEGEATALYVAEQLAPLGVSVTRIGYGMPIGGDLEYVDAVTVRKSLENRRRFDS